MIKQKEPVSCDVLVIGGGIAGLCAAIGAAEKGADVIVAEKANTLRSGSGATGNDHFQCYLPEVHGEDMEPIMREMDESLTGGCLDSNLTRKFLILSAARVKEWDSWGIDMRPHGDWEFTGHAMPGRPRIFLKYAGHNQKKVLTEQALKRGVRILNRTAQAEIITEEGRVTGSLCIDISEEEPKIQVIRCKSLIIATGNTSRLYAPKSGWMFNRAFCPACAGNGRAAAYRAGARLVNMDMAYAHAGPKYFNRCGKATWIGVYKDLEGKPVGSFVTKPTKELGDITGDVWIEIFGYKFSKGDPVYMDCSETSPEDIDYMKWGLVEEGNTSLLDHMDKENIDLGKHMVEFAQYEPMLIGRGIEIDEYAATNIAGLYAAGDEVGNFRADIAAAAVYGRVAGESAAEYAKTAAATEAEKSETVKQAADFYSDLLSRGSGTGYATWQEANVAMSQIMSDYAGMEVRSERLFRAGLTYLRRLQGKMRDTLGCGNSHDLMRCLEVMDLAQVGEILILCASERKETRGRTKRLDFPFVNPLYSGLFLTIRQQDGEPLLDWREKK